MKSDLISILFSTVSLLASGPIGSIRNRMANIVALIDPIKVASGWLTDVDTTAKQLSGHWRHALREEEITTTISNDYNSEYLRMHTSRLAKGGGACVTY